MRLFVVDPHPIYRRGLTASLGMMDGVDNVTDAASISAARERSELAEANLVVLDCSASGGLEFIRSVRSTTGASVLVCTSDTRDTTVAAALREGASGFVSKDALTHEVLHAALTAVASGASVIGEGLLDQMFTASVAESGTTRALTQLTDREHGVLTLIAQGMPTREIAQQLSYSERTVKNVLHDVVTKLGVRSRSQAVAQAVRDGLI